MVILIPLCLCSAVVYVLEYRKKAYQSALLFKTLASLFFVLYALFTHDRAASADLIVWGLVFGALADVFLGLKRVVPKYGNAAYLFGVLLFQTGHIMYLLAIARYAKQPLLWILLSFVFSFFLIRWIMSQINADKVYRLFGIVAECKADTKVSYVFCFNYIQFTHFLSSYNFLLIFVLRTLFFITKNFTHLSTMFL
jgi:uncharacterized membrane protein YhhN